MNVPRGRETFLLNHARTGGPVARWRAGGAPTFLVNDPALAHDVLSRRAAAFVNPHHPYAALAGAYAPAGAYALHLANGARERAAYGKAMARLHAAARAAFRELEGEVDLEAHAKALLFSATIDLVFGLDVRSAASAYVAAVDVIEAELCGEPPLCAQAPSIPDAHAVLDDVGAWIARALGQPLGPRRYDDTDPITVVTRTVLNAYNATGTALAWIGQALATRPELQAELAAEAADLREPTPTHLRALGLHRRVVLEALRLWPPAWALGRKARADLVLGDVRIPAGASVSVSPYTLHRDRRWWEEPGEFRPERFRRLPRHHAWLPFGEGTRRCPAAALAPGHLVVLTAALLDRRRLVAGSRGEAVPHGLISLRPDRGVWVRITSA